MPRTTIEIDQAEFPRSAGQPFTFDGIHSGGRLAGIEITTTVYSDAETEVIEQLLRKKSVAVIDPFSDRTYDATLRRKSSMYQTGRRGTTYHFEVRELDNAPEFSELNIEGHTFVVIRSFETAHTRDEVVSLNVLLRLSPTEFRVFQGLLKSGAVRIQRIGIDTSPIGRRFGGGLYWSSHEDSEGKFYKQIARFLPTDYLPEQFTLASGQRQLAQSEMILALSARYDALVRALAASGHLSQEISEALLSEEWRTLVNDERAVMMRSKLTQVGDADRELV